MPPQNPTDKKAAEDIRLAEQRIKSHQAPLQEAIAEHSARLEPTTGQPIDFTTSAAGASSTAPGDGEEKDYYQVKLLMDAQERRRNAAEERFTEFSRSNNWPRPPVPQATIQRIEESHRRRHEEVLRLQTEAQQALERAGNTEPVRTRLNPDAAEFHPGQASGAQGGSGTQGQ
ncbi:cytochrome c heme lyase [Physcia stellaris]|nr:cytochrome c heme lyase [Physcia stellaris]